MGAEPYQYFVPYDSDAEAALQRLRNEVFQRGDYDTADENPSSIEEAVELGDADGTASILDIEMVSDEPDFACAAPFTTEELSEYFGSERPSRGDLQAGDFFWDDLERGHARFLPIYENNEPKELCFVGYSFD